MSEFGASSIDLNALMLFLDVAEAGSLTEAARRTGTPKSTLSRKLNALEASLGVRLVQRSSRRFSLTDPGRRLAEHARQISKQLGRARRDIRALGDVPQGTLRVATSVSLAEHFLSPIVVAYLHATPRVDLQLELSPTEADLIEREIDVAIRVGAPDDRSVHIARRLGYAATYLCASPAYLARRGTPRTVGELKAHDAIFYRREREAPTWSLVDRDGDVVRVSPHPRLTVDSHPVARAAALSGVGVAFLPAAFCGPELAKGELVRVLPEYQSGLKWVYATFPSRDALPAAVRSFVEFVAERLDTSGFLLSDDPSAKPSVAEMERSVG